MRTTAALPLALAALVAAGATATADVRVISDPAGDHVVPAGDVVSADLRADRHSLSIELTMAGAPSVATPYAYSVSFTVGACRFSAIYYMSPVVTAPTAVGCRDSSGGTGSLPEARASVFGSTIRWVVPLRAPLRTGVLLHDITATTAPGGLASGGALDHAGDAARADRPHRIGD